MDSVTLTVGIPDFPFDLACAVEEQNVTLSWRAYRSYESISVLRDGEVIATLTDNETSYVDEGVEPGDHTYTVQAEYEGESGGESCDVTVESLAPEFVRGDINDDGSVDIADPISLLGHLFGGEDAPTCPDTADANDDGQLDIADAIYILSYLFADAAPPPAPFDQCGPDPTEDEMVDCVYTHCGG